MAHNEQTGLGLEDIRLAVAPVALGSSLQAWTATGLQYLLLDIPAREGAGVEAALEPSPAAPEEGETIGPLSSEPVVAAVVTKRVDSRVPHVNDGEAKHASFADCSGVGLEPSAWPRPWAACFARVTPSPLVWTYHDLGEDLLGKASSSRGSFFRSLIGELRLPKGFSSFWPCAVPSAAEGDANKVSACPEIFAAGLRRISPRHVIAFGDDALVDMGLSLDHFGFFRNTIVGGRQLVLLPSPEALMANETQRFAAVSLLRVVLAEMV